MTRERSAPCGGGISSPAVATREAVRCAGRSMKSSNAGPVGYSQATGTAWTAEALYARGTWMGRNTGGSKPPQTRRCDRGMRTPGASSGENGVTAGRDRHFDCDCMECLPWTY